MAKTNDEAETTIAALLLGEATARKAGAIQALTEAQERLQALGHDAAARALRPLVADWEARSTDEDDIL